MATGFTTGLSLDTTSGESALRSGSGIWNIPFEPQLPSLPSIGETCVQGGAVAVSSLSRFGRLGLRFRRELLFGMFCLFIGLVSVHDTMLIVANHDIIGDVERNPVGKWLIDVQAGQIWLFVVLKLAGTALVCTVLVELFRRCRRIAMTAAAGVGTFQMVLLTYLTFA